MDRQVNTQEKSNKFFVIGGGVACGLLCVAIIIAVLPKPPVTECMKTIDQLSYGTFETSKSTSSFLQLMSQKIHGGLYYMGLKSAPVWSQEFFEKQLAQHKKSFDECKGADDVVQQLLSQPPHTLLVWGDLLGGTSSMPRLFVNSLLQARQNGYIKNDFKLALPASLIFAGIAKPEEANPVILSIIFKMIEENPGAVLFASQEAVVKALPQATSLPKGYFCVFKPGEKPEVVSVKNFLSEQALQDEEEADEDFDDEVGDEGQVNQLDDDPSADDEEADDIAVEEDETPDQAGGEEDDDDEDGL